MKKQQACLPARQGFTLIETLIVISVVILIVSLALFSYRYFEKKTELETITQKIVATLKLAQTKTLASENNSQYGVHFENNQYILFSGDTYQVDAPDKTTYSLPSRLEINDLSLNGGGSNVVFQRINGQTDQNGTISLRMINEPTKLEIINIHPSGQIELSSSLSECCNTNRLTDGRHIHLNLNWSIQNSETLTLYFPEAPEVTNNIVMADYINLAKTEFDWSGTIDVNGQNQELRIHTHSLDMIETGLCIHHDGDTNNKILQISIDAKDIVSFTADGQPTLGFWGGSMEIQ